MASRFRSHNPFSVQLQSDPSRSIFVQQLLARALQNNGRPSRSVAESADIASAPIIAALLAKQDQKAQAQQMTQQKALANQLVGGAMRTNIPLENLDGQPADNYSVPTEGPTGAKRQALAGILAQNPQAMSALAMQQISPPQQEGYTLGPGQGRFQGNQQIASMPAPPNQGPSTEQLYNIAKAQGYKGTIVDYQKEIAQAGASNINTEPLVQTVDPKTGKGVLTPRSAAAGMEPYSAPKAPKEPTDTEVQKQTLYQSVLSGEKSLQGLADQPGFTDLSSRWQGTLDTNPVTRTFESDAYKQYKSAAGEWVSNLLYLKSGATVTPSEKADLVQQYFPQPGDGPETRAFKQQKRLDQIEILRNKYEPEAKPYVPPDHSKSSKPNLVYDPATGTFK